MSLPMLQTARLLLLRPLQEDDAEGLHTAYGDADAMRGQGSRVFLPVPVEDALVFFGDPHAAISGDKSRAKGAPTRPLRTPYDRLRCRELQIGRLCR